MSSLAATERAKYERIWRKDSYRAYSPGEQAIPIFAQLVRKRGSLLDIGCGTGRAGAALRDRGYDVTLMDFAANAPEPDLPFINQNLWTAWPHGRRWDYGYCCDVMEHIPPKKVDAVLRNIFEHCGRVFFSIHFGEDNLGKLIGHPLHLTVQPFTWWRDKLREYREVKDARDLIGVGTFYCA